ncbi:MAG: acyl carrier protein [Acutalibacteraceae bacterium]
MIFEKLKKILSEQLEINENLITLESNIVDDLGATSLDLVDLAMSIEDEFGIEVPDELVETVQTVADVVNFIEEN